MSLGKGGVVLLLLLLAVLGTKGAPGECEGLNKTLTNKDLDKIVGEWILVWSVSDRPNDSDMLKVLTSSRVELKLKSDNQTMVFSERNLLKDGSCINYFTNLTVSSDNEDVFQTSAGMTEEKGVLTDYHDNSTFRFFEMCTNCLSLDYQGNLGHFLLIYRREGHHQDVEQLQSAHGNHQKLAGCVGLPHDSPYIYDGSAGFCQKKSPEVKPEQA